MKTVKHRLTCDAIQFWKINIKEKHDYSSQSLRSYGTQIFTCPKNKSLKSIGIKTCYIAIIIHMKNIYKTQAEKHLRSRAPFHLPKPTTLHPKSYIRDVLTCRAFNTSRYHEPRPSKHRHSIAHNMSISLSIQHIANNMNYKCMNMSYA